MRIYFSEPPTPITPPLEILDLSLLSLQIPEKTSFHSWKSYKNSEKLCDTLWRFQGKKSRPMEIPYNFFLNSAGNSTSFFIYPWNFHTSFLQYPYPYRLLWNSPLLFMYAYFHQVMIWSIPYTSCVHDLLRRDTSVQV